MPDARINVPMNNLEFAALLSMAQTDCRHPREQLRHLLREEARKRDLLTMPRDDRPEVDVSTSEHTIYK